jgi:signal transduction histidine kinase
VKSSLARRIFLSIFAIGVINVLVTLIAIEYIYEDMEDTILRLELAEERQYLEQRIDGPQVQHWNTALLTAVYVPQGVTPVPPELPELFDQRPVPFSAEVDIGDKTYLISIEPTVDPPGILYIAQDITLLEDREDFMQIRIALLCFGMLALGLVLARHGTARVLRPLRELTGEIRAIAPGTSIDRIRGAYTEQELAEIARTLNEMLAALDDYVRREKSLVSLASHELRTPLAVIAGALDVIDRRGTLAEADRRTLQRIRQATDEMHSDVAALLKLARRSDADESTRVDLSACVADVVTEIETSMPEAAGRITHDWQEGSAIIVADPALARMLLRNLLQNAARHTRGHIHVRGEPGRLTISDAGPGLPAEVRERMAATDFTRQVPEDGLGLFIVRLICERLAWRLRVVSGAGSGSVFELEFGTRARSL